MSVKFVMRYREWLEFPSAPCLVGKKTWWELTSWCCWNLARCLTCFLSASVTKKDLQFGTWTDPLSNDTVVSVPQHLEVGQAEDLSAPPCVCVCVCVCIPNITTWHIVHHFKDYNLSVIYNYHLCKHFNVLILLICNFTNVVTLVDMRKDSMKMV
jgi:hypothetical protein